MGSLRSDQKILVLEDDEDTVRLLEMVLGGVGYTNVRAVGDGRDAETVYQSFAPDLVLMDLHMPHADGMKLLETMATAGGTPVVVMSGDISSETQATAERAGASAFITKPYDISQVVSVVERHLAGDASG